mgnify:CR=1 FL=1
MKGQWLNTEKVFYPDLEKPCTKLSYCPYGQLVEEFPFSGGERYNTKLSCASKNGAIITFGHDCPVHYHAEFVKHAEFVEEVNNAREDIIDGTPRKWEDPSTN